MNPSLQYVTHAPRRECSLSSVSDQQVDIEKVMEWLGDCTKGTVWWTKTNFRSPGPAPCFVNNRKRNFHDGYWLYSFWFSHKADAAMFRLAWGGQVEG